MVSEWALDPDAALMVKVCGGHEPSFETLLARHRSQVVNHLYRLVRNRAIAEELSQDVFLRVYRFRNRYQPEAKFSTWLFRITRNLVFNEMRRRKHFTEPTDDVKEPAGRTAHEPDQVLLEEELQSAIQEAINQLPESQRMAIILRRYEEMPYEEIAKVMRTTVPAVKSILFRARAELRERLAKYLE